MYDKVTGQSCGYGFVSYATRHEADAAIQALDQQPMSDGTHNNSLKVRGSVGQAAIALVLRLDPFGVLSRCAPGIAGPAGAESSLWSTFTNPMVAFMREWQHLLTVAGLVVERCCTNHGACLAWPLPQVSTHHADNLRKGCQVSNTAGIVHHSPCCSIHPETQLYHSPHDCEIGT